MLCESFIIISNTADLVLFSLSPAIFSRIVSKSGASSSQADVTCPSLNRATAGVVTNHSLVSANRPSVQGAIFAYRSSAVRRDRYKGDSQETFVTGQIAGHLLISGYCPCTIGAVVMIEQNEPGTLFESLGDIDMLHNRQFLADPGSRFEHFVRGGNLGRFVKGQNRRGYAENDQTQAGSCRESRCGRQGCEEILQRNP